MISTRFHVILSIQITLCTCTCKAQQPPLVWEDRHHHMSSLELMVVPRSSHNFTSFHVSADGRPWSPGPQGGRSHVPSADDLITSEREFHTVIVPFWNICAVSTITRRLHMHVRISDVGYNYVARQLLFCLSHTLTPKVANCPVKYFKVFSFQRFFFSFFVCVCVYV